MDDSDGFSGRYRPRIVSDELLRFRQGELTLEQYLDSRLEVALDLIRGRVSAERLEMIREVVREVMADDPTTREYVRQLTSSTNATRPRC